MCQVSVIIPNYNHCRYLTERIESVLNQTFDDFEVIILDDCSTDDSRNLIEKYRHHPKVSQIIFNKENSNSTFKQWHKGFEKARGKYIWIAESDDYCEPSLLANLMPSFLKDENIVLSFCQSVLVTDSGNILSSTKATKIEQILDGKEFVLEKMMVGNSILNASMVVFKKSAIEKIPNDYMKMRYCGDWLFWTNLCISGKIYVSGKFLNYYRRHDNNVTNTAVAEGLDFIEGNQVFDFVKNLSNNFQQIENAEKRRIALYLRKKKLYKTSVNKIVVHSLRKIIPGFKKYIFVLQMKLLTKKLNQLIHRKLKL